MYQTKKISYFLSKKDKVPDLQRSNLIYEFTCPGCNEFYIGKTERNLNTRLKEHLDPAKSAISKHLTDCDNANYLININNLYHNVFDSDSQTGDSPHHSFTNITQNNTRILLSLKFSNSNLLLFLEALHIKLKKPELNSGLKASKVVSCLSVKHHTCKYISCNFIHFSAVYVIFLFACVFKI